MAETDNLILKLKNIFKNLKGWFYLYYVNVRERENKGGKRKTWHHRKKAGEGEV